MRGPRPLGEQLVLDVMGEGGWSGDNAVSRLSDKCSGYKRMCRYKKYKS